MGLAKVLSQTENIFLARAILAILSRSMTFNVGLVGVSIHTSRVLDRIAEARAFGSDNST
jgi:hypothetical protein